MPRSCDVCHASSALVYCRADAAFLCMGCDVKVHGANKLASRHERVWMCEVCEQSPAVVTCKADAAALCLACDTDIHTANPLASRHERLPVMPFYECPSMVGLSPVDVGGGGGSLVKQEQHDSILDSHDGDDENDDDDEELSVAEAESWLLPSDGACKNGIGCDEFDVENMEAVIRTSVKPSKEKAKTNDSRGVGLFPDDDLFLDLEHTSVVGSSKAVAGDSIVPVHHTDAYLSAKFIHPVAATVFSGDVPLKAMYSFPAPSLSNSISSSSLDFGVVPDSALCEESTAPSAVQQTLQMQNAVQLEPMAREARVLRYREKRKNRKFEKTIRYASRKAYAEIRPRIKGRFVKRTEVDAGSQMFSVVSDAVYGVVPSL